MSQTNEFPIQDLQALPFFDEKAWTRAPRDLSSLTFFVKGAWHCWVVANARLCKVAMTPIESNYFGDAPERATDQCFRFLQLTAQRASFPEMRRAAAGISNDFQNLATSLAKIRLFFAMSQSSGAQTTRFVQTEMEYIVFACRSVFDLLQEMIASLWERIDLLDRSVRKKRLPKSFADILFRNNACRSVEDIVGTYGLPLTFAKWYVSQAPFFGRLRSLRDAMAHGGRNAVDLLFAAERGFAIQRGHDLWCGFYEWPKAVELPNQIVPLRPALCAIIQNVIAATDSFAKLLEESIVLPDPLFPGLSFFSRGCHDQEFHEIDDVLRHSWWCDTHNHELDDAAD